MLSASIFPKKTGCSRPTLILTAKNLTRPVKRYQARSVSSVKPSSTTRLGLEKSIPGINGFVAMIKRNIYGKNKIIVTRLIAKMIAPAGFGATAPNIPYRARPCRPIVESCARVGYNGQSSATRRQRL